MLEIDNLSVRYGRHQALDGVSAKIEKGEICVILGANGAGKSSLLKAIAGTVRAEPGSRIVMNGVSLVGSRYISEEGETILATFFSDGKYMLSEDAEEDDTGESGAEYGTYAWDPVTGVLTTETLSDTNGEWGLSHPHGT